MVLLCNTFITDTPPSIGKGHVFRENLRSSSNFAIFKYSLASLASAYDWKRVILYITLDENYKPRQQELETFIKEEFEDFDLILRWNRNEYQADWKDTYDLLNDELIWFYCNHDHIFIDSSQDCLNLLVNEMRKESNELVSLAFSHWPENIRTAKLGGSSKPFNPNSYEIHENYLSFENESFDSIQIITKNLYRSWWFDGDFNHIKLPRPDYFGIGLAEIKPVPIHKIIVPYKELCRHFDGYQHCNPPITNDQCPAIEIPDGFFESNIKIRYGFHDIKEGWVTLNPLLDYKASFPNGIDYKWIMEDIPLFWNKRIKDKRTIFEIDHELMLQYKLKSVLESVYTAPHFSIDLAVEEKILTFNTPKAYENIF